MLVHICCSVDSHFFLQELEKIYPNEKLIGFFYDPNIHQYSEYKLRLQDVKRSCRKLKIRLIEGKYDYENWINLVRGYEKEPEKGKRCELCFDNRLEITAQKALEIGEKSITTTLLTSPKKSIEQLSNTLKQIAKKHNLKAITPDFRKNGGTSKQFELAKKDKLYHQDYCGCVFALNQQRIAQKKYADELISPIGKQILPESIEQRIKLYKKVIKCEEKGLDFRLLRERFLNYRLLNAYVKSDKILPSYFLFYSFMKRNFTRGKITHCKNEIHYFNRENIIIIDLEKFNILANTKYKSVKELIFNPPKVKKELKIRKKLQKDLYAISPIVVLDFVVKTKLEIGLKSYLYEDVRELLAIN